MAVESTIYQAEQRGRESEELRQTRLNQSMLERRLDLFETTVSKNLDALRSQTWFNTGVLVVVLVLIILLYAKG